MTASEIDINRISEICSQIETLVENYSSALVKLALFLNEDIYSLHSAVITFLETSDKIEDEKRDYGKFVLVQKRLESKSICGILNELVKSGTLIIEGLPELDAKGGFTGDPRFVPSQSRFGYLKSDWPAKYIEYSLRERPSLPSEPLVSLNFPIYPNGTKAVIDFLNLRTSSTPNSILIQIPNYRVKITDLTISGLSVKLTIEESKGMTDDLLGKFYVDWDTRPSIFSEQGFQTMHSPNLELRDNYAEYKFEEGFQYILAVVVDRESGETLDYREYHFSWPSREGITLERGELDISEIIRRGENLTVEFKRELGEEFLETVVAFSNTRGGLIFLGVADDTKILGYQPKKDDQIANLIASNIEPIPNFDVRIVKIGANPITIVEIPEGDNKPYSHRQLGFYVRSAGTDRRATRTDLDRIYQEKDSTYQRAL